MRPSDTQLDASATPAADGIGSGLRWPVAFLWLAAVLAVAPFVALSFFSHPQNDDYVFAAQVQRAGVAGANVLWYLGWSGRYFATAVMSVSPLALGVRPAYAWMPAATIAILVGAAVAFVSAAAPAGVSRAKRLLAALALVAVFLVGMPNLPQGIYWMTGAVTYQVGAAMLLLVVAAALAVRAVPAGRGAVARCAAGALAAVAAAGASEIVALQLVWFLIAAVAADRLRGGRARRPLAVLLLVGLAATAVAFLAPGNRNRALASGGGDVVAALVGSVGAGIGYLGDWVWTPLPGLALLAVPWFVEVARRDSRDAPNPAPFAAAFLLAYFGSFFPSLYGGGVVVDGLTVVAPLETRTVNAIYGFFLVGFLWTVYATTAWLTRRSGGGPLYRPRLLTAIGAAAVVAATLAPGSNWRAAVDDLASGAAARYDAVHRLRYELIASCGTVACAVPRVPELRRTLWFFEDAVDERSDGAFLRWYKGRGYAWYFRKHRIRLAEP